MDCASGLRCGGLGIAPDIHGFHQPDAGHARHRFPVCRDMPRLIAAVLSDDDTLKRQITRQLRDGRTPVSVVDEGRGNASNRSNGRSDAGLERARIASQNLHDADNDLRNHPNIANDMHVSANNLRAGYQTALASNPNLTFGNYVAATRLAQNLGSRNPAITRDAILAGLANGDSIGKTLRNLGLTDDQAKAARKRVDEQMKQSKKKS